MKKVIQMGLHSSKDSNYYEGEEIGLKGEALHNFSYALYEVMFDVEVDMKTGDTIILTCDGKKLEET